MLKSRTSIRAKFALFATAIATAVTATLSPVAPTPEADAQTRCPAVAVIAARGSGQNTQIYRTKYSWAAPWTSNGWEGETIRAFLQHAERRYAATHGGNSLMKDVEVIGLEPRYYPATFPEYDVPSVAVPSTILQALALALQYANPVWMMARRVATEFVDSVQIGRTGVMQMVNDYEHRSGCRPKYILSGYSQGAMILLEHERELARRGQLAGVVYFGNPNTAAGDWSTVGVPAGGAGGMLGFLPFNTKTAGATPNRVNYCLPQDSVCDLSIQTLQASQPTGGNHARYFRWPSRWDNQVSDAFGRFVDQVRYR
ncbi:Cutinase [Corynebacterium coyleae]|uniref:Cutinase family protein n=1 Tax=Corynebacterium coyleae TaxID=53374 RepID=A0AAP6XHW9_9CORY|nr:MULTISPECIES: cutinase family protein [Corynebacterium]MDK6492857.1 cutinase family protein [Corynebacterium coyleae]MDK8241352.1 cutinase family protein [Corynebacterium coyleae]MDK8799600.1 cutinase family protein [Corynebacterium coyleae]MDK8823283.1 cutinase family protein [Corynebacterium coyleae]NJJ03126.1 cutinase family protein [Corynebacterium coyleae]